jgi:hypothetical protein
MEDRGMMERKKGHGGSRKSNAFGNLVKVRKCLNGEIEVGILGLERSAN